jgi:phage baseplate assembly protein W
MGCRNYALKIWEPRINTNKKVIIGWKISQQTDHEIKHANALIREEIKQTQLYL